MSERGLWNELLSGVGLKVWTMCLRWSWSSVEKMKERGWRAGRLGWEIWRERERQTLLLVLSLANQCNMQNTGEG